MILSSGGQFGRDCLTQSFCRFEILEWFKVYPKFKWRINFQDLCSLQVDEVHPTTLDNHLLDIQYELFKGLWRERPILVFHDGTGRALLQLGDFPPHSFYRSVVWPYYIPDNWWTVDGDLNNIWSWHQLTWYPKVDPLFRRFLQEARSAESVHHTSFVKGHTEVVYRCLQILSTGYPAHQVEPE